MGLLVVAGQALRNQNWPNMSFEEVDFLAIGLTAAGRSRQYTRQSSRDAE